MGRRVHRLSRALPRPNVLRTARHSPLWGCDVHGTATLPIRGRDGETTMANTHGSTYATFYKATKNRKATVRIVPKDESKPAITFRPDGALGMGITGVIEALQKKVGDIPLSFRETVIDNEEVTVSVPQRDKTTGAALASVLEAMSKVGVQS